MTQRRRATVQGEVAIFWSDAASKASGENSPPAVNLTEVHPVRGVGRKLGGGATERLHTQFAALKRVDVC